MSKPKHNSKCAVVVLAAGRGTRMRSDLNKVMHKVAGEPMIAHVLRAAAPLQAARTVVVVAPQMSDVCAASGAVEFAVQGAKSGTGGAALSTEKLLKNFEGKVLILCGDAPLVMTETLRRLLDTQADIAVLGMRLDTPTGYGRLITQGKTLLRIVEERDATAKEKSITLCNSGMMAVSGKHLFALLSQLKSHNAAREYYLTDIVALAVKKRLRCLAIEAPAAELRGINTRTQLAEAEALMQQRLRALAVEQGATLIAPETIFLSADTKLGRDVIVHPYVVFGKGVTVEDRAEIKSYSHIEGARIGARAIVGPFARLRPGAKLEEEVHIGNFVEVKNSRLARGTKANHLSYIGDAEIGERANIGAGTITCNYDGKKKHKTIIGSQAFIGSNTALVAPVVVGQGAVIGAGSVITDDVPKGKLAIARGRQVVKP